MSDSELERHKQEVRAAYSEAVLRGGEFPGGKVADPIDQPERLKATAEVVEQLIRTIQDLQARVAILERAHGLTPQRDSEIEGRSFKADMALWAARVSPEHRLIIGYCTRCERRRVQWMLCVTERVDSLDGGCDAMTYCLCEAKNRHYITRRHMLDESWLERDEVSKLSAIRST